MRCLIISVLAFMLSLPVAAQDFEKALNAYIRGDYAAALSEYRAPHQLVVPSMARASVLTSLLARSSFLHVLDTQDSEFLRPRNLPPGLAVVRWRILYVVRYSMATRSAPNRQ